MLNRVALLLRYKQPFIDWINGVDPDPTSHILTLAEINDGERTVYLIEEVEDETDLERWMSMNFELLFESELHGWYTDPALWPKVRSLGMIREWCSFELHTVIFDTGGTMLEDDDP